MDESHALGFAALGLPVVYGLAALFVSPTRPFARASLAAAAGGLAAAAVVVGWLITGATPLTLTFAAGVLGWLAPSLRLDAVTAVMVGLVGFIAFVIVRFSGRYLGREPGRARYVRWLMATLAAVSLLVVSNSLLWLGAAWVATSLALHQLLTFFRDRPRALIAAHKKFLVSRVADVCLWSAIAILGAEVGGLGIDAVHAWAGRIEALPQNVHLATVLLVVGASLKCAQLPFHGWLTQVMEAPTPVSALLHAGIVNIGGFLMIRLAPLMERAEIAQFLLVAIGSATAVIAALVMTTRVSVKVSLAWSTCAQMGFMLVQCGLGAYQLALLHLVAHSLYKAHAFLSTGGTVEVWTARTLGPRAERAGLGRWAAAALVAIAVVVGVGAGFGVSPASEPALWSLGLILALALTSLLVRGRGGFARYARVAIATAGVATLYFAWHALFGRAIGIAAVTEAGVDASLLGRVGIVGVSFSVLFVIQAVMHAHPEGRLARALWPPLYAGLYLDELFTRLTFRLWPARLPPRPPPHLATAPRSAIEAQET